MTGSDYFAELQDALRRGGCFRPVLVIDKARLDANIDHVKARLPAGRHLRLVDKSLAVLPLLAHLMQRLETSRIMSFHLPIARAVLNAFPQADILFGKPMPAAALRQFFAAAADEEKTALSGRVVHLVDSAGRLDAYREVARASGLPLRFAAEIDVGLHRGGFDRPEELHGALAAVAGDPLLRCEGLMGYEPHIQRIPRLFGGPAGERARVNARLAAFAAVLPAEARKILNTGGSKTSLGYGRTPANEVSMGSAFLLPGDFDGGELQALQPALFIATPVLKVVDARLPGPAWLTRIFQRTGRFPERCCYTYGGKWTASPVFPPDLRENALWGQSSNQQLFAIDRRSRLQPDDFAFFRPTQSEAVLQQFGPVLVYEHGRIIDEWAPLPLG